MRASILNTVEGEQVNDGQVEFNADGSLNIIVKKKRLVMLFLQNQQELLLLEKYYKLQPQSTSCTIRFKTLPVVLICRW